MSFSFIYWKVITQQNNNNKENKTMLTIYYYQNMREHIPLSLPPHITPAEPILEQAK